MNTSVCAARTETAVSGVRWLPARRLRVRHGAPVRQRCAGSDGFLPPLPASPARRHRSARAAV